MAFDFFNISGSMYTETSVEGKIRSSAQGLFMMMTNGVGAVLGSWVSGEVIERFFTLEGGGRQWPGIWFSFAAYALVTAILFALLFRDKQRGGGK
jgi:NHS family xanthosine MFS transporter